MVVLQERSTKRSKMFLQRETERGSPNRRLQRGPTRGGSQGGSPKGNPRGFPNGVLQSAVHQGDSRRGDPQGGSPRGFT